MTSQSRWRAANQQRVVGALLAHGGQTQAEIARRTGLSRATVSSIVQDLRDGGAVSVAVGPGQRGTRVRATPVRRYAAGIDIAAGSARVAIVAVDGPFLAEAALEVEGDERASVVVRLVDRLLAAADAQRCSLAAVGLSASGSAGSAAEQLATALSAELGRSVAIGDGVTARALAEARWGAGRGCREVAYVQASEQIVARLVVAGRAHQAPSGPAGELGHLVIDADGPVCRCGNRGCLETAAGLAAVLQAARLGPDEAPSWERLLRLARGGDPRCRRGLAEAGRLLGVAVGCLCTLLAPGVVVIDGELATAGELVLAPLRESMRRHAPPAAARDVGVVPAALAERAGALGAARLAALSVEP